MVRRAAAVLVAAGAWLAWTYGAPHLPRPTDHAITATLAAVALPLACLAIVAYAGLFRQAPTLQVVAAVAGILVAVWGMHASWIELAGMGKLVAAGSLGLLAAGIVERSWHVALIAIAVIGVDIYSVFAGPTRAMLEGHHHALSWLTVPLAGPGMPVAAEIGSTDMLFLALFVGAAWRFRLRPGLTIPLCVGSLSATLVLANWFDRALPALPLLALAFLLPNLRRLSPTAPPLPDPQRPATAANQRRNLTGRGDRAARWVGARDGLWEVLDPIVRAGASVAVVGAGNCDDVPLTRLAERAGRVDLLDVDTTAPAAAIRREPRGRRDRLRALDVDVTGGLADRIVREVAAGRMAPVPVQDWEPVGDAPYDVVVGDLLYSQLLYPGLLDAHVPDERIGIALRTYGDALTGLVVSRLQASAPAGRVVHVDDPVAWWEGHDQPFTLRAGAGGRRPQRGGGAAPDRDRQPADRGRPSGGAGGAGSPRPAHELLALAVRPAGRLPGVRLRHVAASKRATHSTWCVCGNMSTGRTRSSR